MRTVKLVAASALIGATWAFVPATGASAHVHGITPLRCTPSPIERTGANQTDNTPASSEFGGPILPGVIPINMGGNVPLHGGGFDAAVCDDFTGAGEG